MGFWDFFKKKKKGYTTKIKDTQVNVLPLKELDKYDSKVDKSTTQLHQVKDKNISKDTLFIIEYTMKGKKEKIYFDLPRQYGKIFIENLGETKTKIYHN